MEADYRKLVFSIFALLMLTGCAGMQSRAVSSSYSFLYPEKAEQVEQPGTAVLNLPVRVGIAFVPETQSRSGYSFWQGMKVSNQMPEAYKQQLLRNVADAFEDKEFIDSIEVIPSAFLRKGGSFENLDQLATMYHVDVVALVSYDQIQVTDEGAASLAYWTLVGAYLIEGEKNTTTTLIDTAVYDIKSRRMLFRAPGTSEVKASATLINQSEALRENSMEGMSLAADEMIRNLDLELERFREKVKERPNDYRVTRSDGYSGGGEALPLLPLLFLSFLLTIRRRRPG